LSERKKEKKKRDKVPPHKNHLNISSFRVVYGLGLVEY